MSAAAGGLRTRRGPALILLPLVLLCVALGIWQVQRLHWKEGLIAQRAVAEAAPPVAAPADLPAARALGLHRVTAEGVFLNDKEILLHAIGPRGELGFHVLTPLRETGGRIVFINRGFVPAALRDPGRRSAGQPPGKVRVEGFLRLPSDGKPSWFRPDNRPAAGEWFRIDLPAMAAAGGLADVAPFYIDADAAPNPGGWPKGGASLPKLPNNHLQYAITWFALAAAGLAICVTARRR